MPKRDDALVLAKGMLEALRQSRGSGVVLSLAELAARASPGTSEALIRKAVKKKAFIEQTVAAQVSNLESPVALQEDASVLVASPRLFTFLLQRTCTPAKPVVDPDKLAAKLPAPLQPAWREALRRRLEANDLPEARLIVQGRKRLLHWTVWPIPRKAEETLADALLARLRACHRACQEAGAESYPTTLGALQEAVDANASATLWKKVLATTAFRETALLALKATAETPIVLRADRQRLLESDLLFRTVLDLSRSAGSQAHSAAELKKKANRDLQAEFAAALERRGAEGRMPAGIASVLHKKKRLFFRMDDAVCGRQVAATERATAGSVAPVESGAFAPAFDAAFVELDRRDGGLNFVSLVDLRKALGTPHEEFDRELQRLRLAGRYTLSAAEGRHGIGAEARGAAIQEDGALLLYVSRRR